MIKCTHCGCQLTSRLTVWVHVHSGNHRCDGEMDIGVPIMDARGRIIRQDAATIMGETGVIYVCSACGDPVESEPCPLHQPHAYAKCVGADVEVHAVAVWKGCGHPVNVEDGRHP